jgi:Protein of unknown function (DUF3551)
MCKTSLLGAAALVAALIFHTVPAFAQGGGYRVYPWCAIISGGRSGGATNCYFSTWEQCRAAASGNGGFCYRNPWYEAYGPYYSFKRSYRPY